MLLERGPNQFHRLRFWLLFQIILSTGAPDRDSSEEDADEPDSDDSSEMDETECERRRSYCIDNLGECFILAEK